MKNSTLNCDPETGACEIAQTNEQTKTTAIKTQEKPIHLVYFTDPICSSCWAIEGQLKKLKADYGDYISIEYKMGGLLKDWSYNSGEISKPSDVAHHWDEMGAHYDMPLDGDVWLEDPLDSSYPPSIAFKAAQEQDQKKALLFLREIREMVFTQKKNITKWEHLKDAAKKVKLNINEFKESYRSDAKDLFNEDLIDSRSYRVRGFPTIFFKDKNNNQLMVYGAQAYESYERVIKTLLPNIQKTNYKKDWKSLFKKYTTLTTKEFSILSELPRQESEQMLNKLHKNNDINKTSIKNGDIWELNN